jgi:hypothetical protein
MTVNELLPTLTTLPRADQLRVMQFLMSQLVQAENRPDDSRTTPLPTPKGPFRTENTYQIAPLPTAAEEKQLYLARVTQLFTDIEQWLTGDLHIDRQTIEITESIGTYPAPSLIISLPLGEKLAEIRPVGARIIAAEGEVDLKGWLGTEDISFYSAAPTTTLKVSLGKGENLMPAGTIVPNTQIYEGIEEDGWYWIDDRERKRAYLLNKDLLLKLISRVSNYDF